MEKQTGTHTYKDLIVWQKSMDLVFEIYRMTPMFPRDELFGLVSQMQRAVVSIPSNIAEGYLRHHNREYIQFLYIALGSGAELETQLLICRRLEKFKDINVEKAESLLTEILKMLYVMVNKIKV